MKTKHGLLVGLALAACEPAKYPLCNTDGAPACGNIGQTGRDDLHAVIAAAVKHATTPATLHVTVDPRDPLAAPAVAHAAVAPAIIGVVPPATHTFDLPAAPVRAATVPRANARPPAMVLTSLPAQSPRAPLLAPPPSGEEHLQTSQSPLVANNGEYAAGNVMSKRAPSRAELQEERQMALANAEAERKAQP